MKYIYAFCFWIFLVLTLTITIYCLCTFKYEYIKDFSLPLLAAIFTVGQLWHNEKKQEFEEKKYLQSRKDLYFDKKVEIALEINKYIFILSSQLSQPIYKRELEFNHAKFFMTVLEFYANVVDKAKFLFDTEFIDNIRIMIDLMEQMQYEIQIMQNHLMLSEQHRECDNFKIAEDNYYKLLKQLMSQVDKITHTCVEKGKI